MNNINILILIAALQFKHFICDGPLQTRTMVEAKSHYGQIHGLTHAGLHGISSLVVLSFFEFPLFTVCALAALDAIVHYHIDYMKENVVKLFRWSPKDKYFWWSISADQMLHQFTYIIMVGLATTSALYLR
jgi:Protein of unknown function (DUF3307)